ncbi:MAG: hypothetical protein EDR02_08645 [Actinobacteria bacterium]|nr:MAG: hypothetical protein EDR02_08645 [Actinomycetota bacterium]RIK08439.1 MAG: hypothetical protein DCC48_00360 [Acidobacteriota bacterium]
MAVSDWIVCVDCGGRAYLITHVRPDATWEPGDIASYRCRDCHDRWDVEVSADDLEDQRSDR